MFKFGFDLPTEGDGAAGTDAEQQQQEAPQDVSGDEAHLSTSDSNKPQLSVLDMSDAITSVFESDTLFEYVPASRQ